MKKILFISVVALVVLAGFFYITVYMSKPSRLQIVQDEKAITKEPILTESQLHLYLSKNAIYAIAGADHDGGIYTIETVPKLIAAQKQKWNDSLFVRIKTFNDHSYQTAVDVLDQMNINQIKNYNITEVTKEEEKRLAKHFKHLQ